MNKNSKYQVRLMNTNDYGRFVELVNEYVLEYQKTEKVYPVHFDPKIGKVYWNTVYKKPKKYIVLIAEIQDIAVGFIVGEISIFSPIEKAYFDGDKRGVVWDFYVQPQFRGKNIGTQLISEIEVKFQKKGCFHLVLNGVSVSNEKAGQLYSSLGYKPWQMQYFKQITKYEIINNR